MALTQRSESAEIRARLDHPVIDADGHTVEYEPALVDYLKQVGGAKLAERYVKMRTEGGASVWYRLSPQERHDKRFTRPPWWPIPTRNTLDRATAMLPRLLRERLDETGIDFTVLYPTLGLSLIRLDDDELRPAVCRALNTMHADIFREQADRMTPAATIPMHTPAEAISELEYAIGELGLKAIMIAGHVRRPIPEVAQKAPEVARYAYWIDNLALDSAYDYDPVWAKCVELKVAPTAHSGSMGWGSRTSVSNYMFNHIGHFAAAGEAFCKALFMGGVTRRFPTLKFGFLECGAGWASNLYADMVGHWEKRNREAIENYNPAHLDRDQLRALFARYGGTVAEGRLDRLGDNAGLLIQPPEDSNTLDDWAACRIERAEDIRDLFVPNFYFGCEADDPMNAWAFNGKVNPFGARLQAMLSSDIGHWDVPDIREVLAEAYELVDKQVITSADFRDFVFTNPATLYSGMNPDFFKGTVVQGAVEQLRTETTP
jgi:predicted TIM-barrel fold metal-dependent hydrolase